jgi:hypothetical protein
MLAGQFPHPPPSQPFTPSSLYNTSLSEPVHKYLASKQKVYRVCNTTLGVPVILLLLPFQLPHDLLTNATDQEKEELANVCGEYNSSQMIFLQAFRHLFGVIEGLGEMRSNTSHALDDSIKETAARHPESGVKLDDDLAGGVMFSVGKLLSLYFFWTGLMSISVSSSSDTNENCSAVNTGYNFPILRLASMLDFRDRFRRLTDGNE